MKFLIPALFLLSSPVFASTQAHDIMAECTGTLDETPVAVNVYLDAQNYCRTDGSHLLKGILTFSHDGFGYADDTVINYGPTEYFATANDGQIKIFFDEFNSGDMNPATLTISNSQEEPVTVKMECSVPDYQMDCDGEDSK